jgi:hypothetical protein
MGNHIRPIEGNETVKWYNTMVNYGQPNSENLDDFMRLDASFGYSFNFTAAIKATLRVGSSISLMKRQCHQPLLQSRPTTKAILLP